MLYWIKDISKVYKELRGLKTENKEMRENKQRTKSEIADLSHNILIITPNANVLVSLAIR